MKFAAILFWETAQNLPMMLAFFAAIRILRTRPAAALAILLIGIAISSIVIQLTDMYKNPSIDVGTLIDMLVMAIIFFALAAPVAWLCSTKRWQAGGWRMDAAVSAAAGAALSIAEGAAFEASIDAVFLHALAMSAAALLILRGVRVIVKADSWAAALGRSAAFILVVSVAITLIDYSQFF